MTGIIDYDAGNMKSVEKALRFLGEDTVTTSDPSQLLRADRLVLPGVGAFGAAMASLERLGLISPIRTAIANGTPFLGICLGLQLLFSESEESPGVRGLSVLPGKIVKLPEGSGLKIPHMGWNSLRFPRQGRLFAGLDEGTFTYFVHSYYLRADEENIVTATTEYGVRIHASVESGNVFACQFHPEKSSEAGLHILRNFLKL